RQRACSTARSRRSRRSTIGRPSVPGGVYCVDCAGSIGAPASDTSATREQSPSRRRKVDRDSGRGGLARMIRDPALRALPLALLVVAAPLPFGSVTPGFTAALAVAVLLLT